jgi:hypothetical protein
MTDQTCESRIDKELEKTLDDLRRLWMGYTKAGQECPTCDGEGIDESGNACPDCDGEGRIDVDGNIPDLGNLYEYGLSFDYVAPQTFTDQEEGFFRYQLSTGGPGDEFRIYADKVRDYQWSVYRIEYVFLDWFDGASRRLYGEDRELVQGIFESFFADCGSADIEYQKALED